MHSPEPWTIKRTNEVHYCLWDAEGEIVLNNHTDCEYFPHDLTPERIVAAVNACRGIPTEQLAEGVIPKSRFIPSRDPIFEAKTLLRSHGYGIEEPFSD